MFLANRVFNFHLGICITATFLLVNVYLVQNVKKIPLKYWFLCLFRNIGPNLAKILPQRPHPLYFLWLISNEICQGIQLILITFVAIQQSSPKMEIFFWQKQQNKSRSSASRKAVARVPVPATTILKFALPVVFKSQNSKVYR